MGSAVQLVLMGLRGSGKTTLGRALGTRLNRPFIDLDDLVAARLHHPTVAAAWAAHGQARFREEETAALREHLGRPGSILALGGGTPTAPGAADLLAGERDRHGAILLYLRAQPADLRARLAAGDGPQRPSITGAPMLEEIEAVFAQRDALYARLASAVIDAATDRDAALEAVASRAR